MNSKILVEGQPGLYRDEVSGAILNCSDTQYKKYLELKNIKKKQNWKHLFTRLSQDARDSYTTIMNVRILFRNIFINK